MPTNPTQDRPTPGPPPSSPTRPSPSDDEARSASSPTASSAASEFAADPGPAFDPEGAPAAPEPEEDRSGWFEDPHWEESTIRDALVLQGEIAHSLVEWRLELDGTDVWQHTQKDLRAIAPPLTRILNRYEPTRLAAAAGDEALLAAGLMRYASRNVMRTRRAMANRQPPAGPQPVTGTPAEPGTGPEHDPDWQRVHSDPLGGPPNLTPKGSRH
ncbi:MAG: hypothetical protein ACJ768_09435 [Gaiellaceae bacterium]